MKLIYLFFLSLFTFSRDPNTLRWPSKNPQWLLTKEVCEQAKVAHCYTKFDQIRKRKLCGPLKIIVPCP